MEESLKLLDALASKLSVPVEHLWQVMVTQAPVNSTIDIFSTVIPCIIFAFMTKYLFKEANKDNWESPEKGIPAVIGGITLFFFALITLASINGIITGFINPEYWALMKIKG